MTVEHDLYVSEDLPADHRSGFVAVVGKPNVGKSTLMNALLDQKVAIVSPKPQTTRNRLLGILTRPDAQVVFIDTPGVHKPRNKLGEFMVQAAQGALPDADLACFLVDVSQPPATPDRILAEWIQEASVPALLVLNKMDLAAPDALLEHAEAYRALGPFQDDIAISALNGHGLDDLLQRMIARLPQGPRYFPADQVTDQYERFIAGELIREQVLKHLQQEVPHAIAVVVEQFKEREEGSIYIEANIFVEKGSQKGIVIGRGGSMLKRIGQAARIEIERMIGTQVYLDLWVKVLPNWRKNEEHLRRLGYQVQGKRR